MRVIDRFHTAAGRLPGPRPSGSRTAKASVVVESAATAGRVSAPMSDRWNRRRLLLLIGQVVVLALLLSASAAYAQPQPQQPQIANDVGTVLDNIRTWIMGILAGLATVFLTIGGVRYVMASGDPGEVEKAKTCFKSAGWGYGLAALAPLVITILAEIVAP
jgi:MFS family permease